MSHHEEQRKQDEMNATQKAHIRNAVEMYRNAYSDLRSNGFYSTTAVAPPKGVELIFISEAGVQTVGIYIGDYDGDKVVFDKQKESLTFLHPVLWKKAEETPHAAH